MGIKKTVATTIRAKFKHVSGNNNKRNLTERLANTSQKLKFAKNSSILIDFHLFR